MRLLALYVALMAGSAFAQNNPPPNNPPAAAPAIQAPVNVPPPSIQLPPAPGRPAASAVSDPLARRLNLALGLAGGLRKEVAEGRAAGERSARLQQELEKIFGALRREHALVKDRSADEEVWGPPYVEAQRAFSEVARLRERLVKLPPTAEEQRREADQQLLAHIQSMAEKLAEASRKRHESAQTSIRNVR